MRFCTSLLLSLAVLLTSGCGLVGGPTRFEAYEVEVAARGPRVQATVGHKLQLSRAARRALHNGVPLVLRLNLELQGANEVAPAATRQETFEIRYLPMSERYELLSPERGERRTYPRLRHVLHRLSRIDVAFDDLVLPDGPYEARTRLRLDRASLPAPMQLPSVVYRTWRHDSEWSRWPFRISA